MAESRPTASSVVSRQGVTTPEQPPSKKPKLAEITAVDLPRIQRDELAFEKGDDGQLDIVLGEGTFGSIRAAKFTDKHGQSIDVAAKTVIKKEPDVDERIRTEAVNMLRVGDHPNLVKLYGIIEEDGKPIILVLDRIKNGLNARKLIQSDVELDDETKRRILVEVCNALEHLHKHGIVHRDISSANVLIECLLNGTFGRVFLVDLELARLVAANGKFKGPKDERFDRCVSAPESMESGEWMLKSDIFSFGTLIWTMFNTEKDVVPFAGEEHEGGDSILEHLRQKKRLDFGNTPAGSIAFLMKEIAEKCWEWDVDERPTIAAVRALLAAIKIEPISSVKEQFPITKRGVCVLKGDGESNGRILFEQSSPDGPTTISGEINGLTPGEKHAMIVHEFGDLRNGWKSTGGHWNPFKLAHGGHKDPIRHMGDLGNVEADTNGVAKINLVADRIALSGPYSIIGRALMAHENEDDLGKEKGEQSKRTGNVGAGLAWGIVGVMKQ